MSRQPRNLLASLIVVCIILLLAACSNGNNANSADDATTTVTETKTVNPGTNGEAPAKTEPATPEAVTLNVVANDATNFEKLITEAVMQKFPYITFKSLLPNSPNQLNGYMNQLAVSGQEVDLIFSSSGGIDTFTRLGFAEDLYPLVKKHNMDLSLLNQDMIQLSESYSTVPDGLPMIPITYGGGFVLLYNKDLFDLFNVPYPTDGMTWDETYEIAKNMTRTVNEVQYIGFGTPAHAWYNNQLSLGWVDPKTDQATIYTDGWLKLFTNYQRFYQIPGNTFIANPNNNFSVDKNLAMLSTRGYWGNAQLKDSGVNWDMVSVPTFADLPGVGTPASFGGVTIPPVSEHQDVVMEVVKYLLSEEYQLAAAMNDSTLTILNNKDIQVAAANTDDLKSKNFAAVFANKAPEPAERSEYEAITRPVMNQTFQAVMNGTSTDAWAALQEAEERANQLIKAAKVKE